MITKRRSITVAMLFASVVACTTQTRDAPLSQSTTVSVLGTPEQLPGVVPGPPAPTTYGVGGTHNENLLLCPTAAPAPAPAERGSPTPVTCPGYPPYPDYPPYPTCPEPPVDQGGDTIEKSVCDERVKAAIAQERAESSQVTLRFWPVAEFRGPALWGGLLMVLLVGLLVSFPLWGAWLLQLIEPHIPKKNGESRTFWVFGFAVLLPFLIVVILLLALLFGGRGAQQVGAPSTFVITPSSGDTAALQGAVEVRSRELAAAREEAERLRGQLGNAREELATCRATKQICGGYGFAGPMLAFGGFVLGLIAALLGMWGYGRVTRQRIGVGIVDAAQPTTQPVSETASTLAGRSVALLHQRVLLWKEELVEPYAQLTRALAEKLDADGSQPSPTELSRWLSPMYKTAVTLRGRLDEIISYCAASGAATDRQRLIL